MESIIFPDIREQLKAFFDTLPCRVQKPYPDPHIPFRNPKIAELLLNAFADGGNAEFTAIAQYFSHVLTIAEKEVAETILCISLVEMHHLELVGIMVESLGGEPRYWRSNKHYWSGGYVNYGDSLCAKINADILAEQEAINGYTGLLRLLATEDGPGAPQTAEVIRRILEDEFLHLNIFTALCNEYCRAG